MVTGSKVGIWNRALQRIGETELVGKEDEDRPSAEACDLHYEDVLRQCLETYHWPWAIRQLPLTNIDSQRLDTAGDAAKVAFDIPFAFSDPNSLTVSWIDNAGVVTELDAADAVAGYVLTTLDDANDYVTIYTAPAADEKIRIEVATTRVGWAHTYTLPADLVTPVSLMLKGTRYTKLPVSSRPDFEMMLNEGQDGFILCADLPASDFDALMYVSMTTHVAMFPRKFVDALVWGLAAELALALRKDPKLGDYCTRRYMVAMGMASAAAQNIRSDRADPITPSLAARR